ncbi:hypothetical protein L249_1873 [Ophiocordyceps polyrhachis-furcata BCC 54312]|uniref:Uncharacterized protein n=1 Tax=Ophiocordyceps polyrhachis-furcata BCC 54312 TaxID=1330021 RepID=A0A367LP75_9HYPO|nr:hypothetical protein L249_1873 [Ophiocordyceps polyrhachis-furcata BCC 54312]
MSEEETKIKAEPTYHPLPRSRRREVKQSDTSRLVPCAACVGRLAHGTQRGCFEQASPHARRCFACAKIGTKCQPVSDAAAAAAKALAKFVDENWPLSDKDEAARRFRRVAEDEEFVLPTVLRECEDGGGIHSWAHSIVTSYHARPQMNQHMTMQHPQAWVFSCKPEDDVPPPRHGDGVFQDGILQVDGPRRMVRCKRVVTTPAVTSVSSVRREEVEGVAVEVDRV